MEYFINISVKWLTKENGVYVWRLVRDAEEAITGSPTGDFVGFRVI